MKVGINFVVFNWKRWQAALAGATPSVEQIAERIISNEDIWSVQTYLQLVSRGFPATVGPVPRPDTINIVDGLSLWPRSFAPDLFCVGCRGDGHYPGFCHVVIHQNTLMAGDYRQIYIPQWPQPGIIPRSQSRSSVETIGFFGHASINLAEEYRDKAFRRELQRMGCGLVVRGKSGDCVNWGDYSEIDLVLSVRSIPDEHLLLKPFNKLVNSWAAGVPALLGPEPAIQAIAAASLDYVTINEPSDVFRAIETFRREPDLYRRMVDHGRNRVAMYSSDNIAALWIETLSLLETEYRRWLDLSETRKLSDFQRRSHEHHFHLQRHYDCVLTAYERMGFGPRWWQTQDL